jgi:two-component system response regulator
MNDREIVDVLLVEDNPQDSELTIRALKKNNLAGNVKWLQDGAEALDFILSRGTYINRSKSIFLKVVLLDLKLPKVDGLEVLQEIKNSPDLKTIPVVIITSSAEDPDIKKAYELGANSYVVKPVNYEHFTETIKHLGHYWLFINQFKQ